MKPMHLKKTQLNIKKWLLIITSAVLMICCVVGVSNAWLISDADPITNTFVGSNLTISLTETTGEDYEMIPNAIIAKDPCVTALAGSVPSYVFVKVEKSAVFDTYVTLPIRNNWQVYTQSTGDYTYDANADTYYIYTTVDPNSGANLTEDVTLYILADGSAETINHTKEAAGAEYANGYVRVNSTVTNDIMDAISNETPVTCTFTACAIQCANLDIDTAFVLAYTKLNTNA